jgi:hypothetical protein
MSFFVAVILVVTFASNTVLAAHDSQFYMGNGIFFYDPDDAGCGQGSDSGNATASVVTDNSDNLKTFLEFFTGKGLSLAAAAGMAGNIRQESNFNPAIIQGGTIADANYTPVAGKGFGIAQWTDGGRQKNLIEFAKSQSKPITDLGMQVAFIWKEMSASGYKDMIQRLNNNKTDPVAAAAVFHGMTPNIESEGSKMNSTFRAADPKFGYERSGDTSDEVIKNRGGAAGSYYSSFKDQIQDGSGVTEIDTSGSTSPSGETQTPTSCDTSSTQGGTSSNLGVGDGQFTDKGEVKGWANVLANSTAVDRIFSSTLEGDGWCASIVSRTWRGQDIGYGVNYAITLWYNNDSNGIGHADRSPKKGAILIYKSDHQSAGHVTIYLGGNKILNDGKIRDANFVEAGGWNEHYLGWIDPNDLGWKSVAASDSTLKSILAGY